MPDPQDPGTVETSTLEWAELDQPQHAAMLSWYRTLIALRRRLPDVREAVLGEGAVARDGDLLLVRRGELNVVANLGDEPGRLPVALDAEVLAGFGEVRLDDAEVLPEAFRLARQIASNAPLSNWASINAVANIGDMSMANGLYTESMAAALAQSSDEANKRMQDFLNRKKG